MTESVGRYVYLLQNDSSKEARALARTISSCARESGFTTLEFEAIDYSQPLSVMTGIKRIVGAIKNENVCLGLIVLPADLELAFFAGYLYRSHKMIITLDTAGGALPDVWKGKAIAHAKNLFELKDILGAFGACDLSGEDGRLFVAISYLHVKYGGVLP